jgi:hypothetical protein
MHILFFDYTKAFDTVERMHYGESLTKRIAKAHYVSRNIYSNTQICMRLATEQITKETTNMGVRQGYGISPPWSLIYI